MSQLTRSNNNRNSGAVGRSVWSPAMANNLIMLAKAATRAVAGSFANTSPSNGGEWSGGTSVSTGYGGTKRRGGNRSRKQGNLTRTSIPRSIKTARLTVQVSGVFSMLNTAAYQVRKAYRLRVPHPSQPDDAESLFGRLVLGETDYGILKAFRNIKVHFVNVKLTSVLSDTDAGYVIVGFRKESIYTSVVITQDVAAGGGVSYVSSVRDSGSLRYVPTKNKGIMLTDGDDTGHSIEDDMQHVGTFMTYANTSTKAGVGDAVMLVQVTAVMECWNEGK